jgi:acetyl esterase
MRLRRAQCLSGSTIGSEGKTLVANPHGIALDAAAQAFVEMTDPAPHLPVADVAAGGLILEETQRDSSAVAVSDEWITVEDGPNAPMRVRIVTPMDSGRPLPVVIYVHGASWMAGFAPAQTHDRLVRELAVQSGAAILFPEYASSPAPRYPAALEQVYATAKWAVADGAAHGLDGTRIAVAGDSEGANLAIALTLLALRRNDIEVRQLVAFCPATAASFDTESYRLFARGYFLRRDAMEWFWDQYTPDVVEREQTLVSPLRAGLDELADFPPTLIITAEADVLRDEGEAFAAKLRAAKVPTTAVRYEGTIHGFVVLDALKDTTAAKAAVAQASWTLRAALA